MATVLISTSRYRKIGENYTTANFYHLNLKHCNVKASMIRKAAKFHGADDLRLNLNDIPELPAESHPFFLLPTHSVRLPSGTIMKYRQAGHGAEILCVHGLWTTSYTFRSLIKILSESFRVILPELVDYENPPVSDERGLLPSDLAELVTGLCRALELNKPLLVGHEESALAAMEIAMNEPELISQVIAISPRTSSSIGTRISGWWRSRSDASAWARSAVSQPIKAALGMINYSDPAIVSRQELRVLAKVWSNLPQATRRARLLASTMSQEYPRSTMEKLRHLAEAGKSLDVPLKLVYGDMDSNAPISHGQAIISLLPGTELLLASGCGTSAQIERPKWTAKIIEEALQDR